MAGLGDDHASWEPVLPHLTPRYRCITFDNRGIGLRTTTRQAETGPAWDAPGRPGREFVFLARRWG